MEADRGAAVGDGADTAGTMVQRISDRVDPEVGLHFLGLCETANGRPLTYLSVKRVLTKVVGADRFDRSRDWVRLQLHQLSNPVLYELSSDDPAVRAAAAREFAVCKISNRSGPAHLGAFAKLLGDATSWAVRAAAAETFLAALTKDERVLCLPYLGALLADDEPLVRIVAVARFATLLDAQEREPCLPAFTQTFDDVDPRVRVAAATTFAALTVPERASHLLHFTKLLGDPGSGVRDAASSTFAKLTSQEQRGAFCKLLADGDATVKAAAVATFAALQRDPAQAWLRAGARSWAAGTRGMATASAEETADETGVVDDDGDNDTDDGDDDEGRLKGRAHGDRCHGDSGRMSPGVIVDLADVNGGAANPGVGIEVPEVTLAEASDGHYHLYSILLTVGDESWLVFRRFRQLRELHKFAVANVPGAKHLGFPNRRMLGNRDIQVAEARRAVLQRYLVRMVDLFSRDEHYPVLRQPFCSKTEFLDVFGEFFSEDLDGSINDSAPIVMSPLDLSPDPSP